VSTSLEVLKRSLTPVPSSGATPEEWTSYSTGQAGQAEITEYTEFFSAISANSNDRRERARGILSKLWRNKNLDMP